MRGFLTPTQISTAARAAVRQLASRFGNLNSAASIYRGGRDLDRRRLSI
jgi:hypothetical protein